MTFRFIHSADWHLGKTFATMADTIGGELSSARFGAISRIADIAKAQAASHVLVAGDVFDKPDIARVDLRRAIDRMAEHRDITWVLLPGNHDPMRYGGVWSRLKQLEPPATIVVANQAAPMTLAPGVVLLPSPLSSNHPGHDPTAWMTDAATPADSVRIGLAHGSVQGFGSDGDSAITIAADRAQAAGLAYLALGDWHGTRQITPHTWYSGTPEPDRFPDNEPGHVLAVAIDGAGPVRVERIVSRIFTWAKAGATIGSLDDLPSIEQHIATSARDLRSLLVSLTLSGNVSLSEHADVSQWCEQLAARLKWLRVETSQLAVRAHTTDLDRLSPSPTLVAAAQQLSAVADTASLDQTIRTSAALALIKLYGFAAEAAADGTSEAGRQIGREAGT